MAQYFCMTQWRSTIVSATRLTQSEFIFHRQKVDLQSSRRLESMFALYSVEKCDKHHPHPCAIHDHSFPNESLSQPLALANGKKNFSEIISRIKRLVVSLPSEWSGNRARGWTKAPQQLFARNLSSKVITFHSPVSTFILCADKRKSFPFTSAS